MLRLTAHSKATPDITGNIIIPNKLTSTEVAETHKNALVIYSHDHWVQYCILYLRVNKQITDAQISSYILDDLDVIFIIYKAL